MEMALVQDENWSSSDRSTAKASCIKHDKEAVKNPSLLVHVIDGFVIKESSVPFKYSVEGDDQTGQVAAMPVSTMLLLESANGTNAEATATWEGGAPEEETYVPVIPTNCKFCGKALDPDRAFWGKRFCSVSCGKRYSLKCTMQYKRLNRKSRTVTSARQLRKTNLPPLIRPRAEEHRALPRPQSPMASRSNRADARFHSPPDAELDDELYDVDEEMFDGVEAQMKYAAVPVVTWSTEEVVDFISSIPGCASSAEVFSNEEIDGFALMLLKEEHLVNVMGLKLGPALKIACQLRSIKLEHGVRSRTKYLSSPLFERASGLR